ncbi:MAG: hypothetical protein IKW93_07725, partial [Bacteroidales bacterium]|nr:hypothetical protein [Bacteroidales bacterium]
VSPTIRLPNSTSAVSRSRDASNASAKSQYIHCRAITVVPELVEGTACRRTVTAAFRWRTHAVCPYTVVYHLIWVTQ